MTRLKVFLPKAITFIAADCFAGQWLFHHSSEIKGQVMEADTLKPIEGGFDYRPPETGRSRRRRAWRLWLLFLTGGIALLLLSGCFSFYLPRGGIVVEKESGLPVEDAILVRSWDRGLATPAGATHSRLAVAETATDEKGAFWFGPRLHFAGIPIIMWTEENPLIVYRPGFGFVEVRDDNGVIEIPKTPFNRYARYAEARKASSSYATDYYDAHLLKDTVQQEEKLLAYLPELTQGVLYVMPSLNDISFDSHGNLYLASDRSIVKLPRTDTGYDTENIGRTTPFANSAGRIEIEIDHDLLYALQSGKLIRLDVSATAEQDSPLATYQYVPGIGLTRTMHGKPPSKAPQLLSPKPGKVVSADGNDSGVAHGKLPTTPSGSSPPASPKSGTELLASGNGPTAFPYHEYRFALGAYGSLHIGDSWYRTDGKLVGKMPLDVSSIKRQSAPSIVETLADEQGNILVVFFFPGEYGPFRSGIAVFDRDNQLKLVKELPVEWDVTGFAAADGRYFACDSRNFYLMDRDFRFISRHSPPAELFGEFALTRIKVDAAGDSLFLIDGQYGRLLWYDLKASDWREP